MNFSSFASSAVVEDDVKCLKDVKKALRDPEGMLSSWDLENSSMGFICKFVGIFCRNDRKNWIFILELPEMKLSGEVTEALQFCQSMEMDNLSANNFSGKIPVQKCNWFPYLISLDLSNNDFSGPIPPDLGNCTYLNTSKLSNNRLPGPIRDQLSNFCRLKKFSTANNNLTGRIPSSWL